MDDIDEDLLIALDDLGAAQPSPSTSNGRQNKGDHPQPPPSERQRVKTNSPAHMVRVELDDQVIYNGFLTDKDGKQLEVSIHLHSNGTINGSVSTLPGKDWKVLAEIK